MSQPGGSLIDEVVAGGALHCFGSFYSGNGLNPALNARARDTLARWQLVRKRIALHFQK